MSVMPDWGNAPEWVAAAIAAAAALFAWRSYVASAESAATAAKALQQQQAPQFTAEVENPNGDETGHNGWHRLMIRVAASPAGPLDELRVDLLTDGVSFTPGINGVEPGEPRFTAVHAYEGIKPAGLDVGDRAHWRVEFAESDAGMPTLDQVEIRVTATRSGHSWTSTMHADVAACRTEREALQRWRRSDRS